MPFLEVVFPVRSFPQSMHNPISNSFCVNRLQRKLFSSQSWCHSWKWEVFVTAVSYNKTTKHIHENKYCHVGFWFSSVGLSAPQGQQCVLWAPLAAPVNVTITRAAAPLHLTPRLCSLVLMCRFQVPMPLVICSRSTSTCHLTTTFNSFMLFLSELLCCSHLYLEHKKKKTEKVPAPWSP